MRICVTTSGDDLDSEVDPRFKRSAYFMLVDSDTMEFEAVRNEGMDSPGGAGMQAARTVSGLGAEVVITGNVGPNAFSALSAAGIRILTGASGSVRRAVESYGEGTLQETKAGPTADIHAGMDDTKVGRRGGRRLGPGGE
jgi:predicted Fe-Mo cluster-binding NifX family protein